MREAAGRLCEALAEGRLVDPDGRLGEVLCSLVDGPVDPVRLGALSVVALDVAVACVRSGSPAQARRGRAMLDRYGLTVQEGHDDG